jgi:hypothetical protein
MQGITETNYISTSLLYIYIFIICVILRGKLKKIHNQCKLNI